MSAYKLLLSAVRAVKLGVSELVIKNSVQKSRINLDEHFDEDSRLHDTTTLEGLSADDRHSMNYDATLGRSSITFVIVTPAATSPLDAWRAISLFDDLRPCPVTVTCSLTASHVASELAPAVAVIAPLSNLLLTSILSRAVYTSCSPAWPRLPSRNIIVDTSLVYYHHYHQNTTGR